MDAKAGVKSLAYSLYLLHRSRVVDFMTGRTWNLEGLWVLYASTIHGLKVFSLSNLLLGEGLSRLAEVSITGVGLEHAASPGFSLW